MSVNLFEVVNLSFPMILSPFLTFLIGSRCFTFRFSPDVCEIRLRAQGFDASWVSISLGFIKGH